MKECCYSERKAHHPADFKMKLIHRLNRIEGQVKGVRKMIEEDVYCDDVITQITAIRSALNSLVMQLFEAHLKSCIFEQIKCGSDEIMDELKQTVNRLLKQ